MKVGDLIQQEKSGALALVLKTFVASNLILLQWVTTGVQDHGNGSQFKVVNET